jgi:spore coat protein U-like protein
MTFPNYANATIAFVSIVTPTCSDTTAYSIGLDVGLNGGGTATTRAMIVAGAPGVLLNYGLYSDNTHTTGWGPLTASGAIAGTGNGAGQPLNIYGQILAGQLVAPGAYADTITATVTY